MLPALKLVRGLRFRLALSYVLFFSVLLTVIGLVFRYNLKNETEAQVRDVLQESWDGAKAFLHIVNRQPVWESTQEAPDQNFVKERLRLVHLIANANGQVVSISPTYASIGVDDANRMRRIVTNGVPEIYVREDSNGVPYMIKAGRIYGDLGNAYFFAIGRTLEGSKRTVDTFTRDYFVLLPFLIAVSALLGWMLAGRGIRPLNDVAQAAEKITSSNLDLQIPLRGSGDELDHMIENFNRMTARLQESFDQVRQFSTDVSHELRTPLTAIRGQLEVALFTARTPEQYHEAMLSAMEAVEQLSSIIRALLLLSQAESGQLALQRVPLDLAALARDVVDQFQIPAEEKQLVITSRIEPEVVISADRVQIERLLSNLLSNAVKYTPAGGSIRVAVRYDADRQSAIAEVQDTGVGVPKEDLPHIFDRFYRVRNQRTKTTEGLGLGLSFVAWIAKAHGGRVEASSLEGRGSRFTVVLPASVGQRLKAPEGAPAALERSY